MVWYNICRQLGTPGINLYDANGTKITREDLAEAYNPDTTYFARSNADQIDLGGGYGLNIKGSE